MRSFLVAAALFAPALAAAAPPCPAGTACDLAPWRAGALTAAPQEIARAAKAQTVPPGADRYVLFDERVNRFSADGLREARTHVVFRIVTAAGVSGPGIEVRWQPWFQERPEVRARVIAPDGTTRTLDPTTVEDAVEQHGSDDLYGDIHLLRAPYPALAAGAVVEREIIIREKRSLFAAAASYEEILGEVWPTEQLRIVVDAPDSLPLHWALHGPVALKPQRTSSGGRTVLTFEAPMRPALQPPPKDAPFSVYLPTLSFATGNGWADMAKSYARIAESELQKSDRAELERTARAALGTTPAADRQKAIAALLAFVRREVRYVGIELGQSSIVPHEPLQTLQRKYGDCKDQALLLVALLRSVGIPAELSLLRVGRASEVDETLPALNVFNHVIVHVPGAQPLWLDPTDEWTRVGELPTPDQARLTLLVAATTRALSRTPDAPAAANHFTTTREVTLAETGRGHVVQRFDLTGA